jgi:Zn-dependent M28 family amino/carboxypeptidase
MRSTIARLAAASAAGTLFLVGYSQLKPSDVSIKPEWKDAVAKISAASMKGHLSFIASDALEGRDTPSRGLDLAAEYIAAQFRRAGLEPAVKDSYFQEATVRGRSGEGTARNVIGILRGSDPLLKNTYVLVTAHYDHLGMRSSGEGDRIYNGANDDGSGTVSVIELASTLSTLKDKPKRSIVFMCFYGEEKGLWGSSYYGKNPVFPLKDTIAQINLEHMGRTDDSEGARVKGASMTGFDYTDMGPIFEGAGKTVGIKVEKHPQNSDAFFSRSDNAALAAVGIPAHTLCTTFIFPDYHQVGDHWDKVDYENMAAVDRMVGLGVLVLADSKAEPRWNEKVTRTSRYVEAWKKLRGQ